MDEMNKNTTRPVNPRRRKRSKMQIFKEVYLPVIIAGIALVLIFIFMVGSIVRAVQRSKYNAQVQLEASIGAQEEQTRLNQEVSRLLNDAAKSASHLDYAHAIDLLNSFSGNQEDFPELSAKLAEYQAAKEKLVLWNDPAKVLNLSFQTLIADPARAFSNAAYGTSYNRNFVTTGEFAKILQQLYDNGYILVQLKDITTINGPKDLYLPEGKKPLIITQTNVNYYTYMIDGDGDNLPDKDGAGFASKLIVDADGSVTCEMVDATGNTVTGAYDLVPILDSFVESHPDFSYGGAKAVLAVTGYDGIFGYRINSEAKSNFDEAYYNQEIQKATELVRKLIENNYEIACYTYGNDAYADREIDKVMSDLTKWDDSIAPVLGKTDIFVFAMNSDLAEKTVAYNGDTFNALKSSGYQYYIGFAEGGQGWYSAHSDYIRQGRILVSGSTMAHNAQWFEGLFDPHAVLDTTRGEIPG